MEQEHNVRLGTLKQRYGIALLVLAGVLTASMLLLSVRPTEWAFLWLPLLGGMAVALLWLAIARIFLCRDAQRLLAPSFKAPLKLAMIAPAWAVCTLALLSVPSNTSGWDEDLAGAVALGTTVLVIPLFFGGLVVLGTLSIYKGFVHKKATPATETAFYRNAPLAVALGLLLATIGVLALSMSIFI